MTVTRNSGLVATDGTCEFHLITHVTVGCGKVNCRKAREGALGYDLGAPLLTKTILQTTTDTILYNIRRTGYPPPAVCKLFVPL